MVVAEPTFFSVISWVVGTVEPAVPKLRVTGFAVTVDWMPFNTLSDPAPAVWTGQVLPPGSSIGEAVLTTRER